MKGLGITINFTVVQLNFHAITVKTWKISKIVCGYKGCKCITWKISKIVRGYKGCKCITSKISKIGCGYKGYKRITWKISKIGCGFKGYKCDKKCNIIRIYKLKWLSK